MNRALCLLAAFLAAHSGCEKKGPPFDLSTAVYSQVSGSRAMEHVAALVHLGPRPAGSEAIEKSRVYLEEQLNKAGWTVRRQSFEQITPEGAITFVNLIARFGPDPWKRRVTGLLASHYDTKRFSFRFVGANDGGSSTGLLVELAQVLARKPELASRLELVFFDGEEAFAPHITETDGLYGSRHYARDLLLLPAKSRPRWGVLLDMVGDKDLNISAAVQFPGPPISRSAAENPIDLAPVRDSLDQMSRQLLSAANDLEVRSHFGISSDFITDDHVPLSRDAGIPTIDIIDFDYRDSWHTPGDTLDKISAQSLEIVGRVTLLYIEKYLMNPDS